MDERELGTVSMDTTCRTPGCVNEGVTHRADVPVNADGVFRVVCGTCSQAVTDIVPVSNGG
jgi:hypothetical protein